MLKDMFIMEVNGLMHYICLSESQELPTNIPDLDIEETEDRVLPETFQCLRKTTKNFI